MAKIVVEVETGDGTPVGVALVLSVYKGEPIQLEGPTRKIEDGEPIGPFLYTSSEDQPAGTYSVYMTVKGSGRTAKATVPHGSIIDSFVKKWPIVAATTKKEKFDSAKGVFHFDGKEN